MQPFNSYGTGLWAYYKDGAPMSLLKPHVSLREQDLFERAFKLACAPAILETHGAHMILDYEPGTFPKYRYHEHLQLIRQCLTCLVTGDIYPSGILKYTDFVVQEDVGFMISFKRMQLGPPDDLKFLVEFPCGGVFDASVGVLATLNVA